MILWQTGKCNVIHMQKKCRIFPAPIFVKLKNVHQHYVHTPNTKFHPNQTINVEWTNKNSPTSWSKQWLSLHWFSQNSWSPYKLLGTSTVSNFIQIT